MRKISLDKYILAFLITFIIFMAGVFLSQKISGSTADAVLRDQKEIENYILGLTLQSEIASKFICNVDVFELTKDKVEIGKRVDILEKNLGKDDPTVKDLKQKYFLLSVRQWILVKEKKEKCNENFSIIIFFYSNKINKSESESQGYVLDYLYEKRQNSTAIYSFDIDEDMQVLNTIKSIYKVDSAPSIIVNDKLFSGFQSKENIESILT